jgi:hypothetical protein
MRDNKPNPAKQPSLKLAQPSKTNLALGETRVKIKFAVISIALSLTGIIVSNNPSQPLAEAKGDSVKEISAYKTWSKITKEPIKVKVAPVLPPASVAFVIDENDPNQARVGAFNG